LTFVLTLHGEIRWLVALAGVAAIVKLAAGLARGSDYGRADRILMAAFTGLLDLNVLLGLVLLLFLPGGFPAYRLEHAVTMLLAAVAAHLSAAWRKSPEPARRLRNDLIVIVVALALVVVGVLRLRGGWTF